MPRLPSPLSRSLSIFPRSLQVQRGPGQAAKTAAKIQLRHRFPGLNRPAAQLFFPAHHHRKAQRLALARTLAHPRPVLVLDDPFSALDCSTEDTVFADLQAYAKDKVVFLISHRLYHFPQMQQIIFMDGGKTTVGTHDELMDAVPMYRQLYESQTVKKGGDLDEEPCEA